MATQSPSAPSESRPRYWLRVLRPLSWWFALVLVMFGYRTHERLLEETRLHLSVNLEGKSAEGESTLLVDGKPAVNGQKLSLGSHRFEIKHPKAKPFVTNLFVWYGEQDLGQIVLNRSMGLLSVSAVPPARRMTIRGPEFSATLTNTSGMTSSVPTDKYVIEVVYRRWNREETALVESDQTTSKTFAPKLGSLRIESSQPGISYQLRKNAGSTLESGQLPALISELPEGVYQLLSTRKGEERETTVSVVQGTTNSIQVEFQYGAAVFETDPSGATVIRSDGSKLGNTPLTLTELSPGHRQFRLQRDEYEPVEVAMNIVENQTSRFQTNLLSRHYTTALQAARDYFANERYDDAADAANKALQHKTDDPAAKSLQRQAQGMSRLVRGRENGRREDFKAAIVDLNSALELIPDNVEAKRLLEDYKTRQTQFEEQAARRIAAERAAEDRKLKLAQIQATFERWCGSLVAGVDSVTRQEIVTTLTVKVAVEAIEKALKNGPPAFEKTKVDWTQAEAFSIHAEQKLPDAYRHCMVMGGQISADECVIYFKVVDIQPQRAVSVLGGLLTAQLTTQADRDGTRVARFQAQAKEGAAMVKARICEALGIAVK